MSCHSFVFPFNHSGDVFDIYRYYLVFLPLKSTPSYIYMYNTPFYSARNRKRRKCERDLRVSRKGIASHTQPGHDHSFMQQSGF